MLLVAVGQLPGEKVEQFATKFSKPMTIGGGLITIERNPGS